MISKKENAKVVRIQGQLRRFAERYDRLKKKGGKQRQFDLLEKAVDAYLTGFAKRSGIHLSFDLETRLLHSIGGEDIWVL